MKKKNITYQKTPGLRSGSKLLQHSIIGGIALSSVTLLLSLWTYYSPDTAKAVFLELTSLRSDTAAKEEVPPAPASAPETEETAIPMITPSEETGSVSSITLDEAGFQEDSIYSLMLDTAMGPMIYYNQGDSRWGDYLYGGADPMKKYGCGPTAVSMVINSFSPQGISVTPVELADWSSEHGYYAPQSGSYHNIIPDSLKAFGLQVQSVENRREDHVRELLNTGHILVALMGAGRLTENGHFILITKLQEGGNVQIADPNSLENSSISWDLNQLLGELKHSYDSGGPLWAVSLPLS